MENVDAWRNEFNTLAESVAFFRQRVQDQIQEDEEMLRTIGIARCAALDAAYDSLEELTTELLTIEGGEEFVGTDHLPSLPKAVATFHELSKTCEKAVDRIGEEFVDTTQYGGENRQLKEVMDGFNQRLLADIQVCEGSIHRYESEKDTFQQNLNNAQNELNDSRNKQSVSTPSPLKKEVLIIVLQQGFFYGVFGDNDIDNQVRTNEQAVNNARDYLQSAERKIDALWFAHGSGTQLQAKALSLQSDLNDDFWNMNTEYAKLVDGRKRDEHIWLTTRTLDYYVSTNGPDTTRDEVLRHVLMLIDTEDEGVDTDEDVGASKERIEGLVKQKLGVEVYEMLRKEKVYLDMDFWGVI